MAFEYFVDGATDFTSGNWKVANGGAGSGFANAATLVLPRGNQTITTSLDQSALTLGVATFTIASQFTGNIFGTSNAPFRVASTGNITNAASAGSVYLKADGASGGVANTIANLILTGGGQTFLAGGTFTALEQGSGQLAVDTNTIVTTVKAAGGTSFYDYISTAITTGHFMGGSHVVKRAVTTANVGGKLTVINNGAIFSNVGTANVYANGILDWRGGTPTTINVFPGGSVDFSNAEVDVSTTINLYAGAGPVNLRSKSAIITATVVRVAGGTEGTGSH
jgi:hypothetical protein